MWHLVGHASPTEKKCNTFKGSGFGCHSFRYDGLPGDGFCFHCMQIFGMNVIRLDETYMDLEVILSVLERCFQRYMHSRKWCTSHILFMFQLVKVPLSRHVPSTLLMVAAPCRSPSQSHFMPVLHKFKHTSVCVCVCVNFIYSKSHLEIMCIELPTILFQKQQRSSR